MMIHNASSTVLVLQAVAQISTSPPKFFGAFEVKILHLDLKSPNVPGVRKGSIFGPSGFPVQTGKNMVNIRQNPHMVSVWTWSMPPNFCFLLEVIHTIKARHHLFLRKSHVQVSNQIGWEDTEVPQKPGRFWRYFTQMIALKDSQIFRG